MASGKGSRRDPDDDDDPDEDEEVESRKSRPRKKPSHSSTKKTSARHPSSVRRWKASADDEEEDTESRPADRKTVYWRARDSLYFEPLVALAIVVLLIVGLYAYTQNWPPVYVVESDSMQHGSNDQLGLINTGDLVLAQKIANSSITPYVIGMQTGFSTYGEFGDVILYHPDGTGSTPVIHRAILFLVWNPGSSSYSAPDLAGLPCGNATNAVYASTGTQGECGTSGLTGTLSLYHIGWMSVNVTVDLGAPALGQHSGYLTMGDNNYLCAQPGDCVGEPDQTGTSIPVISSLVEPGWIVGVARGMIPWFGAIKLLLSGSASEVPSQSWQYMALTIIGLIALAFGVHFVLRREGIETPLRKEEEAEEAETKGDEEAPEESPEKHRFLGSLRPWHRTEDEEEGARDAPKSTSRSKRPKSSAKNHGRPPPDVHRGAKARPADEDDDEL